MIDSCPWCPEAFEAPGAAREALDHYLTRSRYPFAAANLRNLVPMGHKCNSGYKHATDMLRETDGTRRIAIDPYNHATVSVCLDDSEPFGGVNENTPNWRISFDPDTPGVETWDQVFSVRERYRRYHLNQSFPNWLELFAKFARRQKVPPDSDEAIVEILQRLEELFGDEGLRDRGFLKAAVFRMLRRYCATGHQRLLHELRLLVAPRMVVAAGGPNDE